MKIVARSQWSRYPDVTFNEVDPTERTGFMVHYEGASHVGDETGEGWVRNVEDYHVNGRDWRAIGYNFLVENSTGVIYEGRGWDAEGAHCYGANRSDIGVQVHIGGDEKPSDKALEAVLELYAEATRRYGSLKKRGHRDGYATECPGEALYEWVQDGMPSPTVPKDPDPEPKPDPVPAWDGKSFPGRDAFQIGKTHPAVTVLGERLTAHGYGHHYKVGPGPKFTKVDRAATSEFQLAQGYVGTRKGGGADGFPGPKTWAALMSDPKPRKPQVSLSKVQEAARKDTPRRQGGTTPGASDDVRRVERALVREKLLNKRWVDGSFGAKTVLAYRKWQVRSTNAVGSGADGIPGKQSLTILGDKYGFEVVK